MVTHGIPSQGATEQKYVAPPHCGFSELNALAFINSQLKLVGGEFLTLYILGVNGLCGNTDIKSE